MDSIGPGPAYSLPPTIGFEKHDQRKMRSPQYTMAGRLKDRNVNIIPGPGLNIEGLTRRGRPPSYAFSIGPRILVKDNKSCSPGPANYDSSKRSYLTNKAPPSYSLGRREQFRFKNLCPGPNAYGVKDGITKKTVPAFSIGIKVDLKSKAASPGPAIYPASNLKTTLKKSPEYSIGPRTKVTGKNIVPGANVYDRTNYKPGKSSPSYSFGVRHSKRAPPMVVHCDNV